MWRTKSVNSITVEGKGQSPVKFHSHRFSGVLAGPGARSELVGVTLPEQRQHLADLLIGDGGQSVQGVVCVGSRSWWRADANHPLVRRSLPA